ncbi:hypothetical protein FHX08_001021 [Rhizobium sp. BK529]|uniref:hypothetical protein n=1 Tax=Rhizobium sp. BK529 TaxID=2586983 RepID=UPI00161ECDD0|nr:hypothetical protein [Rhizobium sp. BK529]MBB3590677.1 hypothetical protein [Rhizobium sp. BK529]
MDHFKDQPFTPDSVARDEITTAFREVFATASGKRVLFWMLEQCAVYQEAYAGELGNATHYTLGKQGVGRRLIAELDRIDPTLYPRLLLAIADLRATDKAAAQSRAKSEEGEDHDSDA